MSISAIVLTHNRNGFCDDTVSMLRKQTVPPDEILIAHNKSRGAGVAACRNKYAALATGDWLLFTYDDGIHMSDMVESLVRRAKELGRDDILINVHSLDIAMRGAIPKEDVAYSLAANMQGNAGELVRGYLSGRIPRYFWLEQHCSLIHRDFFNKIGGYDAEGFPGWSLHEQDLAIRVLQAGGIVDSNATRNNGQPLFVFHRVRKTDPLAAEKRKWVEDSQYDFIRKYGRRFSVTVINRLIAEQMSKQPISQENITDASHSSPN